MKYDPVARLLKAEEEGGFITYEGGRWLPSELKAKLLRDGYVLIDRHWMKGKPYMTTVPTLFTDQPQNFKGVSIVGTLAQEESVTFNVKDGQEKFDSKPVRRFYAATPMTPRRFGERPRRTVTRTRFDHRRGGESPPGPGDARGGHHHRVSRRPDPRCVGHHQRRGEVRRVDRRVPTGSTAGASSFTNASPKEGRSHKLNRPGPRQDRGAARRGAFRDSQIRQEDGNEARPEFGKKDNDRRDREGPRSSPYVRLIPEYPAICSPRTSTPARCSASRPPSPNRRPGWTSCSRTRRRSWRSKPRTALRVCSIRMSAAGLPTGDSPDGTAPNSKHGWPGDSRS
jgi:hypothetical protein